MKKPIDMTPILRDDFHSKTAYSTLSSNVEFASVDQKNQVILFTSGKQAEFKSTCVSNLAYQYASLGKKVCILDCDLRHPTISRVYSVPNVVGLVDYVMDEKITVKGVIIHSNKMVDVVATGKKTEFVDKILSSARLKKLIDELRTMYDYILIDSAPVLMTSDALALAKVCDAAILICKQNSTKKKDLQKSLEALKFANVNILGIALTNCKLKKERYSNYYYR